MKISIIFLFFIGSHFVGLTQSFSNQVPKVKQYTAQEIVDSEYGIIIYNKLVPMMGGDSMRYTKDGYNCQSWQEDYYANGKLLHKGFYLDGYIKVFKNYYENGQIERSYTSSDLKRGKLEIFYEDGKVRSTINYYDGLPQNQYDFYKNGSPQYIEENDKNVEFVYKRNSFYENGFPLSMFELIDKKEKTYIKREFYENGKIKEEGNMIFKKELRDYQKHNKWSYYDEKGNLIKTEMYEYGEKK